MVDANCGFGPYQLPERQEQTCLLPLPKDPHALFMPLVTEK